MSVPTAPVTAPKKPVTKAVKPPKEKKNRPVFNAPAGVKFPYHMNGEVATPAGFDHGKNRPLKPEAFETRASYICYKAEQLEWKAAQLRQRAKDVAAGKPTGKVKQLTRMMEKMEELKKLLTSQGIDVAALVASQTPAA